MPADRTNVDLPVRLQRSKRRAGPAARRLNKKLTVKTYSRPDYFTVGMMSMAGLHSDPKTREGFTFKQVSDNALQMCADARHTLGSQASRRIEEQKSPVVFFKGYLERTHAPVGQENSGESYYRVAEPFLRLIEIITQAVEEEGVIGARERFIALSSHLRNNIDGPTMKQWEKDFTLARVADNSPILHEKDELGDIQPDEAPIAGPSNFTTPLRPTRSQLPNDPAGAYVTPSSLPRLRNNASLSHIPESPSQSRLPSRGASFNDVRQDQDQEQVEQMLRPRSLSPELSRGPSQFFTPPTTPVAPHASLPSNLSPPIEDKARITIAELELRLLGEGQQHDVVVGENVQLRTENTELRVVNTQLRRENSVLRVENTTLREERTSRFAKLRAIRELADDAMR